MGDSTDFYRTWRRTTPRAVTIRDHIGTFAHLADGTIDGTAYPIATITDDGDGFVTFTLANGRTIHVLHGDTIWVALRPTATR